MKLKIGKKILEVDIIKAPRGAFSCDLNMGNVFFDELYALRDQGEGCVKVYPIWISDFGRCDVDENIRMNTELDDLTLQKLVELNALQMQISLQESAEEIIFDFIQHDTPFTLKAAKYAMEVLPKDSPVRNAFALKTGLVGVSDNGSLYLQGGNM